MDINVQKLSNISSTGTEQTDNTYNTSEKNINITNTPASGLNNINSNAYSVLKNLMPGDVLSGIINPYSAKASLCCFVPYPLCFANPYSGYNSS